MWSTSAIPERLRGVFTTRRYTNTRLPYLTTLPLYLLFVPFHPVNCKPIRDHIDYKISRYQSWICQPCNITSPGDRTISHWTTRLLCALLAGADQTHIPAITIWGTVCSDDTVHYKFNETVNFCCFRCATKSPITIFCKRCFLHLFCCTDDTMGFVPFWRRHLIPCRCCFELQWPQSRCRTRNQCRPGRGVDTLAEN